MRLGSVICGFAPSNSSTVRPYRSATSESVSPAATTWTSAPGGGDNAEAAVGAGSGETTALGAGVTIASVEGVAVATMGDSAGAEVDRSSRDGPALVRVESAPPQPANRVHASRVASQTDGAPGCR
jgi:hypothetical protein